MYAFYITARDGLIQLLEYPIPPPLSSWSTQKSRWQYLGNDKSYQRIAGVKTTSVLMPFQIVEKKSDFFVGGDMVGEGGGQIDSGKNMFSESHNQGGDPIM